MIYQDLSFSSVTNPDFDSTIPTRKVQLTLLISNKAFSVNPGMKTPVLTPLSGAIAGPGYLSIVSNLRETVG